MLFIIFIVPAMLFSLWATIMVKSTFKKYSRVISQSGLTGAEAARIILDRNGLHNVAIELSKGWLSDHYDPSKRVLRLSQQVYTSQSLSAIGVAAHETGHALQQANNYAPLKLRQALIPLGAFGSQIAWFLLIGGMLLQLFSLIKIGILLYAVAVVVTLVTLPVEFNASSRAVALITNYGIVTDTEARQAEKVLRAAAMTYVAAALTAIAQLLYFLFEFGFLGGDN